MVILASSALPDGYLQMIYEVVKYAIYTAVGILLFFALRFAYQLLRGQKHQYLRSLRLGLNFGILFIFCWGIFMSLAIIVRPPIAIAASLEESLHQLSVWIVGEELKWGLTGLGVVAVLGLLNYWYQYKVEGFQSARSVLGLTSLNVLILIAALLISYFHTFHGLAPEVGYYFT